MTLERLGRIFRCHVCGNRPQPRLPRCDPAAQRSVRRREGTQENLGQPHRPACGEGRCPSPGAQGPVPGRPRSRLPHGTSGTPWSCRTALGHGPAPGARPARRPEAFPRARPGRGDGRGTSGASGIEARPDVGRGTRPERCRRGRAVPGNEWTGCSRAGGASLARPPDTSARRPMRHGSGGRWAGSSIGTGWPGTSGGRCAGGACSIRGTTRGSKPRRTPTNRTGCAPCRTASARSGGPDPSKGDAGATGRAVSARKTLETPQGRHRASRTGHCVRTAHPAAMRTDHTQTLCSVRDIPSLNLKRLPTPTPP